MAPILAFDECVKDSPTFRELLHHTETDTLALENILDKVLRQCNFMNEAEKSYNSANALLREVTQELGEYYKDDEFLKDIIHQFLHVLCEISSFHSILDQAQRSINKHMSHFLKSEVKGNQDLKKMFDKESSEFENASSKSASVSQYKPHEIEESEASMATHKTAFRKVAMEYVFQTNMLHKNKRLNSIHQLTSYMHAFQTFFHQGFELFNDVEPFLKKTADQVDELTVQIEKQKTDMITQKERYQAMAGDNSMYVKQVDSWSASIIEGYLFKRGSNAFKTWSRRWFSVNNNKLHYQGQGKLKTHHQEVPIIVVDDLRLCTIRLADDVERRFCFEVISPSKSFLLQAESDDVRQAWVHSIQSSIQEAYKSTMEEMTKEQNEALSVSSQAKNGVRNSPTISHSSVSSIGRRESQNSLRNSPGSSTREQKPSNKQTVMQKMLEIPGNTSCADCRKHEARWASVNLGIILCIECSGVHRSLGVHISKVRSLTLDSWEPEVIAIMQSLGNDRVNEIYEAKIGSIQIKPGCSNKDRLDFIQTKYVRKEFCALLPSGNNETINSGRKLRRWKIRKSKPRRRRNKKKKDDENIETTNENEESNVMIDETGDKAKVTEKLDEDLFIFGMSKIPDPDGETEVENSDVEDITSLDANSLFYKAAKFGNLPVMLLAKANAANVNWQNPKEHKKTPLIQAAIGGSIRACEYLLINGAKINMTDEKGRTALHYAAIFNHTGIACQFLKRKANHGISDEENQTPLQIAIDAANADIVTLIRLKQMNDEMMDNDPGSAQTDTLVTDVFRDFSHRAACNDLSSPDGLKSPLFLSSANTKIEKSPPVFNCDENSTHIEDSTITFPQSSTNASPITSPSANSNNNHIIPNEIVDNVSNTESTV